MSSVWLSNSVTSSTVPETPLGKGKGRDGELYLFIYLFGWRALKKKKNGYIGKPLLQSLATMEKFGSSSRG